MVCPKCGSENVTVQMVTEIKEKRKKGLLYWIFIGWWWEIFAWLFLTLPKLLVAIFSKKTKVVSKTTKQAVCQSCGHSWEVKDKDIK
jgi:transcription elongation factor Elf1